MRVAVIGAGPAGLAAAWALVQGGAEVRVLEASPGVGGMCRSVDRWGWKLDLGPHRFFSRDERVKRVWHHFAGPDVRPVDRLTRILFRGQLIRYPLEAGDVLRKVGPVEATRSVASYAATRARRAIRPRDPRRSFESWVTDRFGERLYQLFFRTYSEKLWGIPCTELEAEFAAQRIEGLSLTTALREAFGPAERRVDRFDYPTGGTGMIYDRMATAIRDGGGRIDTSRPVRGLVTEGDRVRAVALEGEIWPCEQVVSTMPLTALVATLPAPPPVRDAAAGLGFRNTLLVYLRVKGVDLFPDQWLYVHEPALALGRITNYRNWAPEVCGKGDETVLSLEYWCSDRDPMWREPESTSIARATRELEASGLVDRARVVDGHVVRVPKCYPVYARGYRARVDRLAAYLQTLRGVQAIGRTGAFRYNNQDHSLLMGLLAAENALGAEHDLWAVNHDEEYQERAG